MNDIWKGVGQTKKAAQRVSKEQDNTPHGSHQQAETCPSSHNSDGCAGVWKYEESAYYNVQICLILWNLHAYTIVSRLTFQTRKIW